MPAAWMLYSLVVGAAACIAAVAAERLTAVWGGPRRVVWAVAMIATTAVPWALSSRGAAPYRRVPSRLRAEQSVVRAARTRPASLPAQLRVRAWIFNAARRVDGPARTLWITASAMAAAMLVAGALRLHRERRAWREDKLAGHRVLVTDDVGPALVGFLRPRIVVPRWALDLEARERRFLLHHELEHLGAEDPRLLLVAVLVLVVFPWNAALWWMLHRLRLAIEIDCDTRVVQACGAPREYGLFLLAVGERRTRSLPLTASLAERRSLLERRIHAMTALRPRHPLLASIPFAAIALGAVTLAAQTPQPPAGTLIRRAEAPSTRVQLTPDQVRGVIAAHHPDLAAGSTDDNTLSIVVSSAGEYVASGSSKAPVAAGMVRARGSSVQLDSAQRADIEHAMVARARVEAVPREPGSGMMELAGIGRVDPSLVRDMYWLNFKSGEVSANALRVRVVVVSGSGVK